MEKVFFTQSPADTKNLAKKMAKEIMRAKKMTPFFILALEGDLGGGKTTFLQGFAAGLGIKEKILSPTFVIMKKFNIPVRKNMSLKNFYHLDCYRIAGEKEAQSLCLKKIMSDPENIIAIEWAEKIKNTLPEKIIRIKFKFINDKKRRIIISK